MERLRRGRCYDGFGGYPRRRPGGPGGRGAVGGRVRRLRLETPVAGARTAIRELRWPARPGPVVLAAHRAGLPGPRPAELAGTWPRAAGEGRLRRGHARGVRDRRQRGLLARRHDRGLDTDGRLVAGGRGRPVVGDASPVGGLGPRGRLRGVLLLRHRPRTGVVRVTLRGGMGGGGLPAVGPWGLGHQATRAREVNFLEPPRREVPRTLAFHALR